MKDIYQQTCSINTYNVDRNKVAKASEILKILQESACYQMVCEKPSYDELLEKGKALMLNRIDMIMPEKINLNDQVIATSWPCKSIRATFPRYYEMTRNGEVVAAASSQWSLVSIEERKILKIAQEEFSNYSMGEYKEVVSGKFRFPKDVQLEYMGEKKVLFSDLDYNGHMNNTYYLDMFCDYIPEIEAGTHRIYIARIHYSKEAVLKETLKICGMKDSEGRYFFRTYKSDGEMNVEAEFRLIEA